MSEEEIDAILGARGSPDRPHPDSPDQVALLRAQLRSENVPEEQITEMLGADPHAASVIHPTPVLAKGEDSENQEPMEIDSIPSIDFSTLEHDLVMPRHEEPSPSVTSQPDFEVSAEERALSEAIYESLSDRSRLR